MGCLCDIKLDNNKQNNTNNNIGENLVAASSCSGDFCLDPFTDVCSVVSAIGTGTAELVGGVKNAAGTVIEFVVKGLDDIKRDAENLVDETITVAEEIGDKIKTTIEELLEPFYEKYRYYFITIAILLVLLIPIYILLFLFLFRKTVKVIV